MEDILLRISEDEFYEKFKPIDNHLDKDAGWDGKLYETFGEEREFCFKLSQKQNCVWTVIECDDIIADDDDDDDIDEDDYEPPCYYIVSGFHIINRIGFFITEIPYDTDTEVKIEF